MIFQEHLTSFRRALNTAILNDMKNNKDEIKAEWLDWYFWWNLLIWSFSSCRMPSSTSSSWKSRPFTDFKITPWRNLSKSPWPFHGRVIGSIKIWTCVSKWPVLHFQANRRREKADWTRRGQSRRFQYAFDAAIRGQYRLRNSIHGRHKSGRV